MQENSPIKFLKYIKNGDSVKAVSERLELKESEVMGLIEYLQLEGYNVDLYYEDETLKIFKRPIFRKEMSLKKDVDDLEEIKLCVVSDTHIGSIPQQLTLLNKTYQEAYKRGIKTVLHCGDLVDGDYHNKRPSHPYQVFLHGFDEQCEYVVEMYPEVKDTVTYFIQGSHDETHFLNGGATVGKWIEKNRDDMIYLGQDDAIYKAGIKKNVSIQMHHPGGGSAKGMSYNSQEKINKMTSGNKPKVLLTGHYHKTYYMFYRNVHSILVPCFMDKSGFMIRNSLINVVGAVFLTLYVNNKGEIQYISPEEYLFDESEIIKDDYKKCKKLQIV